MSGASSPSPVAWWIPKAEQFCLAKRDGSRPFAKAWEPLYAAAPAEPAYVLLSSQEMQDAIIDWDPITSTEKLRFARHIESLVVARMLGEGK